MPKKQFWRGTVWLLACFAVLYCFPARGLGQGKTKAAILGTVFDPSGGTVAGADVTVTNTETGLKRIARTDAAGRFNLPQLKPGPYTARVEAEGFEPQANPSVSSGLGQQQTVNFAEISHY